MTAFFQALVSGLVFGGVLALLAGGLALIFGVMRVVNFAHGDFAMLGMYAAVVMAGIGLKLVYVSLVPAMIVVGFIALLLYRGGIARFQARRDSTHNVAVFTLGLSLVLETAAQLAFGTQPRTVTSKLNSQLAFGPISVGKAQFIAGLAGVVVSLALLVVLRRTYLGTVIRAVAQDRTAAAHVGIPVLQVETATFVAGSMLAAAAGVFIIPYYDVTPTAGFDLVLSAFVIVTLAGMESIGGAVIAALLVGAVQGIVGTYGSPLLEEPAALGLFLLVLIVRPQGLFGRREAVRGI